MDSAKPSLELVRSVTDERVLRALIRHRRLTRAELAGEIGISKPTAGESVRRLAERGLVADTGERTPGGRGRGRVGFYYALAPAVGAALAVTITPEGVVAERLDVYGDTVARATRRIDRPARPDRVAAALHEVATELAGAGSEGADPGAAGGGAQADRAGSDGQPVRVAVVSAADPVDRATGRLVHLPDSPFLVGDLDPVAVLAPFVTGPVVVDNDVNWAALAERDSAPDLRDFAYLYLGEGLGCAIVNDGEIRRGRTGLTGEVAHVFTPGPDGRAVRFIELFAELGLRHPDSTAIDVDRLLRRTQTHRALGVAAGGVIAALIALADPQEVVVGGSWGPALLPEIVAAATWAPREVTVRAPGPAADPVLAGVRTAAIDHLRETVARTPA
ncbi:putative NBD/HSP70 family sugar kinase [Actinoplanes octamycinicus]|uniref:Putative NBD/HSP70 family sugar kinase n=1 Tax=Actinoplanes octamycinicus TaxID=135948 RepID=A0A7W7MBG1_9ACTN|nr:ROK family transcriptional regulator [Actinoplanes octamycinicus]MBB4744094.1 putative NBD/HSP70 family sugar kinase [Actinoplanes octamycinicus]GIE56948.1 hypothetical protein Aoc01nite_23500 [Actinoplanes octamycinicus]